MTKATLPKDKKTTNAFNKAKKYTILVLGISWAFGFVCLHLFDSKNPVFLGLFSFIYGFLPAIIAIILNKKEGGNWKSLRFFKPSLKASIIAVLIPIIYVLVGFFLQIQLGYRTTPDLAVFGSTTNLILISFFGFFAMNFMVLGEEIGWRGYLQDKLFTKFGEMKGVIILGIIWGIWHLPVALKGANFLNYPIVEAFITYPLVCIASSFIIAYVGYNKYSIFIAMLLHAGNNQFNATALAMTKLKDGFGFMILSNIICIALIFIFGFLFWKKIEASKKLVKI